MPLPFLVRAKVAWSVDRLLIADSPQTRRTTRHLCHTTIVFSFRSHVINLFLAAITGKTPGYTSPT
jgi:hypothetical protein